MDYLNDRGLRWAQICLYQTIVTNWSLWIISQISGRLITCQTQSLPRWLTSWKPILPGKAHLTEFQQFSKRCEVQHKTSSPTHPKSNGKAKSVVKTAKRLMQRAKMSGRDPYLAILDHRNTLLQGLNASPAQRLLSRRTHTLLPIHINLLTPKVVDKDCRNLLQQTRKRHEHSETRWSSESTTNIVTKGLAAKKQSWNLSTNIHTRLNWTGETEGTSDTLVIKCSYIEINIQGHTCEKKEGCNNVTVI